MGTRKVTCDQGHSHGVEFCDNCKRDVPPDHYELILRRASGAIAIAWCIECTAKSPIARLFTEIPGFNHDELRDALREPRDPRRPPA